MKRNIAVVAVIAAMGVGLFYWPPVQPASALPGDPNFTGDIVNVRIDANKVTMDYELSYKTVLIHKSSVSRSYSLSAGLTAADRNALRDSIQDIINKQKKVQYQKLRGGYVSAPAIIESQLIYED